ncbi:3-isopropylmalate dehydratase small subunit [Inquilinus limosus]|uniref:3-isopropylmalate dehydratase n=1 Tax=Inquilinus limosus TaxID=171674 RepID=A0A211ZTY8_9PROT|nr:3-isopropylmalate dehydratase small subunit [Inquilinus limosus]OWJ68752.1 3-isopropylmalate dehydratase small subunit [Inquilinus limosus]
MRQPFTAVEGVMATMLSANINTDAIIPSAWLRTATADYGRGLFGGDRYDADGRERPGFVLNRPPFRSAKILLAEENFGCGSSREAAVWALLQFGIRCVLAPSFADIFYENAFRSGLLAGLVDPATLAALAQSASRHAGSPVYRVDLPARTIAAPDGTSYGLQVPDALAQPLIRGDDAIDTTLRHADEIEAYYATASADRAWLYAAEQG